jgi:hypothetical protein
LERQSGKVLEDTGFDGLTEIALQKSPLPAQITGNLICVGPAPQSPRRQAQDEQLPAPPALRQAPAQDRDPQSHQDPYSLACIIRERHATEGFGRQRIAEEEDGSVKLMRGTWLQALQAHTIEVATILGRGFALCSFGSGENGNSSGERS